MAKRTALVAAFALACGVAGVHAQDYPALPITLVVPYSPVGGHDVMARIVA